MVFSPPLPSTSSLDSDTDSILKKKKKKASSFLQTKKKLESAI